MQAARFHCHSITGNMGDGAGCRAPEHHQQRQHGERRDHQKLIIVDIGDDLRLLGDDCVECGAAGGGQRIPEMRDVGVFQGAIDRCYVLRDVGVIGLGVADQAAH